MLLRLTNLVLFLPCSEPLLIQGLLLAHPPNETSLYKELDVGKAEDADKAVDVGGAMDADKVDAGVETTEEDNLFI